MGDIDWKFLWNDFRFLFFSYDASIFLTLKDLFVRPGFFVREYLSGKRVRRFSPIRLILTLSAAYAALLVTSNIQFLSASPGEWALSVSPDRIQEWLFSHYGLVEVALVPFLGLSAYVSFRKAGYSLPSHFGAAAYIASQNMVLKILFVVLALVSGYKVPFVYLTLPTLTTFAMLFLTYWQLFPGLSATERVLRMMLTTTLFLLSLVGFLVLVLWCFVGR